MMKTFVALVLTNVAVGFPSYPTAFPYYPADAKNSQVPVKVTSGKDSAAAAVPASFSMPFMPPGMGMGMAGGMGMGMPMGDDFDTQSFPGLAPGAGDMESMKDMMKGFQPMDVFSMMSGAGGGSNPLAALLGQHRDERELDPETLLQRRLHSNISAIEMELMQLDMRMDDSSLDEADEHIRGQVAVIEKEAAKLTKKAAQEHVRRQVEEVKNVLTRVERKPVIDDKETSYDVTSKFVGIEKSDLQVQLVGQRLHMKVKSEEANKKPVEHHPTMANPFAMMQAAIEKAHSTTDTFVDLPFDIEHTGLTSTFKNGQLKVTVPKLKPVDVQVQ